VGLFAAARGCPAVTVTDLREATPCAFHLDTYKIKSNLTFYINRYPFTRVFLSFPTGTRPFSRDDFCHNNLKADILGLRDTPLPSHAGSLPLKKKGASDLEAECRSEPFARL